MRTCQSCHHCKARVGLLGRWDFCTLYHKPAGVKCADFKPKLAGKGDSHAHRV